jgi:tetratricopeptide (TPR) repeat protein
MVCTPSHRVLISVLYCRQTKLWKIADFGLTAKATSRLAITTLLSRGTAGYRAPELLKHSKFTNKVDIWALGCIIYELAMGRRAFSDDFAVQSYSNSRSILQFSIPLLPENHLVYLHDCVREMVVRNPKKRSPISIILALVKSYTMFLDLQTLEESHLIPSYHQWKELIGERPRYILGFFSDLVDWYHSAKQNEALIKVLSALVKRFPDFKEFRQRLARAYEDMGNWNTAIELWKNLAVENRSEEALYENLATALLSGRDCRTLSRVLKELAEKYPENTEMIAYGIANHEYDIALIDAAKRGCLKDVSMLLGSGANVAVTDKYGETALHLAAEGGHKDVVALLLDKYGADVDPTNHDGHTALDLAAQRGHNDVVALLVDKYVTDVAMTNS